MKAAVRIRPGKDFSGMRVREIDPPVIQKNQIRVRMVSSRINPVDMDLMKGMPFLKYKTPQIGGIDGAGTVIETGSEVHNYKISDNIYFYRKFTDIGTWAEEITVNVSDAAKIPENMTVEQAGAAALPILTAYDSLAELNAKTGETLLIHGIAGGVGFHALQIAKAFGLKVIGTASKRDEAILVKAGIDRLIDYRTEKFEEVLKKGEADFVFDLVGGESLKKSFLIQPKKIISVHYMDPDKMDRTGIRLPGLLKWIMKIMMIKYDRMAAGKSLQLIGQVTGADSEKLKKASEIISRINYIPLNYSAVTLEEIAERRLDETDIGKVILFNRENR